MGLLSVSSTISCSSRAMEGATGVRLGRQRRIVPFLFRQVRIHFSHRCNIPSDWLSGQSPI